MTDSAVSSLLTLLNSQGEEARIVGGAVRDAVMGRVNGDIDIATTALPQEIMARVTAAGWKAVPTGIEHGTITVVIAGKPFEVTTLRRDISTDGRHAVVAFTRDFREDAFRRDFTINALSLDKNGTIHDYATGLADAAKGRVRFMGDPKKRIAEDYLRILRFFRFHASHGHGLPDRDGLAACADLQAGIAQLSRERVRQELFKLLTAPGAVQAVTAMDGIALWPQVLPSVSPETAAFRHLVALETALDVPPDTVLRLAAFCGEKQARQLNLKLSRQEEAQLRELNLHAPNFDPEIANSGQLRRLVFAAGHHTIPSLLLGHARRGVAPEKTRIWLEAAQTVLLDPPKNPFRAADAMRLGVSEGPRMGLVLKSALDLWLDAGLPTDTQTQTMMLKQAVSMLPE